MLARKLTRIPSISLKKKAIAHSLYTMYYNGDTNALRAEGSRHHVPRVLPEVGGGCLGVSI